MNDPFAHVAGLPGVSGAVAAARESVDRLLGHRALRRGGPQVPRVSAESALRGARASAALSGADFPLEDVRSGAVASPVVRGALRVSSELGSLVTPWRVAPGQALARLHALAAADVAPAASLGRLRSSAVDDLDLGFGPDPDPGPGLGLGLGLGLAAPPPSAVADRLSSLADLLTSPTSAPALVVAAVVHGELLALRPFGQGDGLVARAAVRLTLVDRGFDPKSLAVPEVGHVELGSAYPEALGAYVSGTPEGVAQWARHCAEAVSLGAREALAVCEAFTRR